MEKEKAMAEEKRKLEEEVKCLERKREVRGQEGQIAKENAARFRREQQQRSTMQGEPSVTLSHISKIGNRVENSINTSKMQLDYTNTRFHNALVVKHDPFTSLHGSENEPDGFVKAGIETTRRGIGKA